MPRWQLFTLSFVGACALGALASCSEDGGAAEARGGTAGSSGGAGTGASGAGGSAGSGAGGTSGDAGACSASQPSLSRLGPTFAVPTLDSSAPKRNPDVAHDSINDVYLVVTGAEVISGTFLDAQGQSLAPAFAVAQTNAYTQTPRVLYGGGKFMVAWHDNRSGSAELRARLVGWTGSADLSLDDFALAAGSVSYHEQGAALAWSETSQLFLVAWHALPGDDIRARRVDASGALIGSEIVITQDADWQSGVAAAWSSTHDEFLLSYTHAGAAGAAVRARRIDASAGSLLGEELELTTAGGTWTTQVAHSPCDDRWFVGWVAEGALGVALDANGNPLAAPFAFPAGHGYPDGFAVARQPLTNTLAAVMHGPSDEDMGCAFGDDGQQSPIIAVTEDPGDEGHFNPRITANGLRQEWLLVTSLGFSTIVAQRLAP